MNHSKEGCPLSSETLSRRRQYPTSPLSFLFLKSGRLPPPAQPVLLQSHLSFVRNTDLSSLKGRKGEIKSGSLHPAGCEDETPESLSVCTDMLLLHEEITLSFNRPEIEPLSSPKHSWEQQGRNQRLLAAMPSTKKKWRAMGYSPSWVTSLATSFCKAWQKEKKASLEIQLAKHWI